MRQSMRYAQLWRLSRPMNGHTIVSRIPMYGVRIGSLRELLPDARVTTYEYVSLHGVTAITDPNGVTTRFDYDNYSRLTGSYYLDENARKVMLQKYVYHFGK